MKEWRVTVPGSGAWASGTWNFPFDTEADARAFAATEGGEVYLRDWGELPGPAPRAVAEVKDKRQYEMLFGRLADFLVEDLLAASDEDILAEAAADDEDPEAVAAVVRGLFEKVDREFMGKHNGDAKRDAPCPGQSDVKLPTP